MGTTIVTVFLRVGANGQVFSGGLAGLSLGPKSTSLERDCLFGGLEGSGPEYPYFDVARDLTVTQLSGELENLGTETISTHGRLPGDRVALQLAVADGDTLTHRVGASHGAAERAAFARQDERRATGNYLSVHI